MTQQKQHLRLTEAFDRADDQYQLYCPACGLSDLRPAGELNNPRGSFYAVQFRCEPAGHRFNLSLVSDKGEVFLFLEEVKT